MSQSKQNKTEKKYPTAQLLKSQALAGYQRDFAKVILAGAEYTVTEARAALDAAMKGGR